MELNNAGTKIDWNGIFILDEFITNFEEDYYIELSSLSKPIRYKLKFYIFNNINIERQVFANKLKESIFNDEILKDISSCIEYLDNPYDYKNLRVKFNRPLLSNSSLLVLRQFIEEKIRGIRKFITLLNVDSLCDTFYFLCPLVLNLTNLTRLSLIRCAFPLLVMLRIGEHLKNLKILNLKYVYFNGVRKQELSPEDAYLPKGLEELNFYGCSVYNIFLQPSTVNFVIDSHEFEGGELKHLQGLKIPSLKKLTTCHDDENELLLRFLKSNPQVEELIIDRYEMTQNISNQISISDKLTNLTISSEQGYPYISEHNLTIPKFNYVKNLKLIITYICDAVANFHSITQYFPNLSHLKLNLDDTDLENFRLNEFLRFNLSSINTLEELTLELNDLDPIKQITIFDLYDFTFDWANFVNVKYLIMDIDSLHLSSISFNTLPPTIKKIKKKLYFKADDTAYIEENPKIFKTWNIEFKGSYVYFTK